MPGAFVPFKTNTKTPTKEQAEQILIAVDKLHKNGLKQVGIIYSANLGQAERIRTVYELDYWRTFIDGSNQAEVMHEVENLLAYKYRHLQGVFRILPITTCKEPGGVGEVEQAWIEKDLAAIKHFLQTSGNAVFGWQNEKTSADRYAIGGGISNQLNRKVVDAIHEGQEEKYDPTETQQNYVQRLLGDFAKEYPAQAVNEMLARPLPEEELDIESKYADENVNETDESDEEEEVFYDTVEYEEPEAELESESEIDAELKSESESDLEIPDEFSDKNIKQEEEKEPDTANTFVPPVAPPLMPAPPKPKKQVTFNPVVQQKTIEEFKSEQNEPPSSPKRAPVNTTSLIVDELKGSSPPPLPPPAPPITPAKPVTASSTSTATRPLNFRPKAPPIGTKPASTLKSDNTTQAKQEDKHQQSSTTSRVVSTTPASTTGAPPTTAQRNELIDRIVATLADKMPASNWERKPDKPDQPDAIVLGDKNNAEFYFQLDKIETKSEEENTFKAMLIAFQVAHPNEKPHVVVNAADLKAKWESAAQSTGMQLTVQFTPPGQEPTPSTTPAAPGR